MEASRTNNLLMSKVKALITTVILCSIPVSVAYARQESKTPIEKEGLLRALKRRVLSKEELIQEVKSRGVNFSLHRKRNAKFDRPENILVEESLMS